MRIALVQQHAEPDKIENLERGIAALERAAEQGAQRVGSAELAFEPFWPQQEAGPDAASMAETIPGPGTEAFSAKAREPGVVVIPNLFEIDGERAWDTSPATWALPSARQPR